MYAVAIGERQGAQPTDRAIAPSALPIVHADAVTMVPFGDQVLERKLLGLGAGSSAGQLAGDGANQEFPSPPCRLAVAGAPVGRRAID
jgi:hypothetical protein